MIRSGLFLILGLIFLTSCASFESRFTSYTGCPEEEIKVLKQSNNIIGNQSYTVSCRGQIYYCTESFIEKQHSNLKCTAEKAKPRAKTKIGR